MCKVIRYKIDNENGSVYYRLKEMGNPNLLKSYDIELLNKICSPKISFDYTEETNLTFNVNLQPYSIELITLELIKS